MACEGIDLSKLNKDELVVDNNTLWLKGQVTDKIYKINNRANVVLEFNNGCFNVFCEADLPLNQSLLMFISNVFAAQQQVPELMSPSGDRGAICGIPVLEKFEDANKAVDSNAINQFGFHPAAIKPNACAIPLRSNVKIYGPFASANFAQCGGTNGESDPDLNPWSFGGAGLMNAAGQAKANSYPANFPPEIETGSITVPELPNVSLGGGIGVGGPNLTGINVSFGSSGITTTYNFQTYTPKPGGFTRLFLDKLKNINKYRQEQIKFLRNNQIGVNKINRRLRIINNIEQNAANNNQVARADQGTCQRVLVGEMYEFHPTNSGERTVVGLTTLPKLVQELRYDFDKKAFMSLDGLYGPVSKSGEGDLPRYASYSGISDDPQCHRASPTLPIPPFTTGEDINELDGHNLTIERIESDPLSNPGQNPHTSKESVGHTVDILGRDSGTLDKGIITNFFMGDNEDQRYSEDYRFLSLRGPLVLHSWGYDTQGKPIPNENDTEDDTKDGKFKYGENKDRFLDDWLQKPSTWPVAPVDLRFDRDRGLWVSPPSYKLIAAQLLGDLEPYSYTSGVIIGKNKQNQEFERPIFDKDGKVVKAEEDDSEAKIKVVDRIGESYSKDSLVYAYYDTTECEYIILSGKQKTETVRFKLINICPGSGQAPPVNDNWGDEWLEYAGYGDKFLDVADSYAIKLNCNRDPIDVDGNILTAADFNLNDAEKLNKIKESLIVVRDVAGQWGPSFSKFQQNEPDAFQRWKQRASEGYAVTIKDPEPSGSDAAACVRRLPCELTYTNEDDETQTIDSEYDIIFLESYARFIHGCLKQDLYPSSGNSYSDDEWKNNYPSGNALIEVDKFYGNVDNGQEPYYLDKDDQPLEIRVFDPWVSSIGDPIECYNPKKYQMYSATSGTPVVAAFNEKLKRYEIIEVAQKSASAVRFRIFGCKQTGHSTPDWGENQDLWLEQAGFFDKVPNNHIIGVRIDCNGNPVDKQGNVLTDNDLDLNGPNKNNIFINLFDTAGKFGPSFAGYKNFNHWKQYASTGFGVISEIPPSGNCSMGSIGECGQTDDDFDNYDIIFLESYARFIHGCLTQDLYTTEGNASEKYSDDNWKVNHPNGNAAVEIIKYYGGPDNEQEPKFWDNNIDELPVRVFDPWVDFDGKPLACYDLKDSPFFDAKEDTPFIAIFNEKSKRYELIQIGKKPETTIRFKVFDICSSETNLPDLPDADDWTNYAGYGDKYYNNHAIGVRIDCDGSPIDINGNLINGADINNPNKARDIFVNLYDTSGKWGPSYALYAGDFDSWNDKAFTGLATKVKHINDPCAGLGQNGQCFGINGDIPSFDVIFIESYARFLHGCLTQDLYSDNSEYSSDSYKTAHPSGNAAIAENCVFYGDPTNGREPKFYLQDGAETKIRVFDPWFEEVDCYDPTKSKFYAATSGTAFTAVFNEKKKKYYLWNIDKKDSSVIRFRLISNSPLGTTGAPDPNQDPFSDGDANWHMYSGYGDKATNAHSVAVKIDCDGNALNKKNEIVPPQDLDNAIRDPNGNLAKSIFINVLDTVGRWGPSHSTYRLNANPAFFMASYSEWVENAATGYATVCDPTASYPCSLGRINNENLLLVNEQFSSYEIIFLESYARFIECTLKQDLYTFNAYQKYPSDEYKVAHPNGNAYVEIEDNKFYGDAVNGREPLYLGSDFQEIPIRVFDPFFSDEIDRSNNPNAHLREGDKVLCVFNEKLKKYVIYSSLKENTKVVKFALVGDKGAADEYVQAILVNHDNMPINRENGQIIVTQDEFNGNIITVRDPFSLAQNTKSRFGPALGSHLLVEHLQGINLNGHYEYSPKTFPFVGFALRQEYQDYSVYGMTDVVSYEMITLEHFAETILGKASSVAEDYAFNNIGYQLGLVDYHQNGVAPVARASKDLPITADVLLQHNVLHNPGGRFNTHSFFVGSPSKDANGNSIGSRAGVDGCRFVAKLDPSASSSQHLVYRVIECEYLALIGVALIEDMDKANELNSSDDAPITVESEDKVQVEFRQGFMWDKNKSKSLYDNIEIFNKCGWDGKALITKKSCLNLELVGMKTDGTPQYQAIAATTIARVGEKKLSSIDAPGKFGHPSAAEDDRKIKEGDSFYHGVTPVIIEDPDDQPKFKLKDGQQFMTHQGSHIVVLWDETVGQDIKDGEYKIIAATEAPVIITGTATLKFTPEDPGPIVIETADLSTCPGEDEKPVPTLILNAENPMGYGAEADDFVTLQRVFTGVIKNNANYKYIVIGTGHPPGNLKE